MVVEDDNWILLEVGWEVVVEICEFGLQGFETHCYWLSCEWGWRLEAGRFVAGEDERRFFGDFGELQKGDEVHVGRVLGALGEDSDASFFIGGVVKRFNVLH